MGEACVGQAVPEREQWREALPVEPAITDVGALDVVVDVENVVVVGLFGLRRRGCRVTLGGVRQLRRIGGNGEGQPARRGDAPEQPAGNGR